MKNHTNQPVLESIEEIKQDFHKWVDWNAHDMGEMGRFIRTKYVDNYIKDQLSQSLLTLFNNMCDEVIETGLPTKSEIVTNTNVWTAYKGHFVSEDERIKRIYLTGVNQGIEAAHKALTKRKDNLLKGKL